MSALLILARPHTSLWDGPRLAWWITRHLGVRNAIFPIDPDYARHPFWAFVLRAYGWAVGGHTMVPLDTHAPFALRTLLRHLHAGRTVVLFPQGTGLKLGADRPDRPGAQWQIQRSPAQVLSVDLRAPKWQAMPVPADRPIF